MTQRKKRSKRVFYFQNKKPQKASAKSVVAK